MKNIEEKILMAEEETKQLQNKRKNSFSGYLWRGKTEIR